MDGRFSRLCRRLPFREMQDGRIVNRLPTAERDAHSDDSQSFGEPWGAGASAAKGASYAFVGSAACGWRQGGDCAPWDGRVTDPSEADETRVAYVANTPAS